MQVCDLADTVGRSEMPMTVDDGTDAAAAASLTGITQRPVTVIVYVS